MIRKTDHLVCLERMKEDFNIFKVYVLTGKVLPVDNRKV